MGLFMRVLLCSPYSVSAQFIQGGITIWAQNIVGYYHSLDSDVQLQVVPYDRRNDARACKGIVKRAWLGYRDYRSSIKETKRQLSIAHFDVLHLCTSASISLEKDLIILHHAKQKGVRTVVHFHFGRIPDLKESHNWEWRLLTKVIKLADAAVVMDMKSFAALKDSGFCNVHYLPNPLSQRIEQQIYQESSIVNREKNRISFVGHVIPSKGVYELVEACRGIDGIKLSVVGKVSDEVKKRMEELMGGGEWMSFKGEIPHSQVINELLSSEIFVLPSYTEGFPNVILESMACGCAIVSTPVGAIPEMLAIGSEKPCGICVQVKDVVSLRNAIVEMLENTEVALVMGNNARLRVTEQYAMPKVWAKLLIIWETAIN